MGEIQALGDAVTGRSVGKVVEPATGQRTGHSAETACLNCGTTLVGAYCHGCGQHSHAPRTLRAFGQDFITGMLNVEGKIFRTLPLLAWRPGDLTRRYIDGQRARFVSPLALFLFSVFVLFAAIQSFGGPNLSNFPDGNVSYHSTAEAIAGTRAELAKLNATRARSDQESLRNLDRAISRRQKSLATLEQIKQHGFNDAVLADQQVIRGTSSMPWINRTIEKARANPQLTLFKLQDATSKFAWLLIPISVPFLWLLFPFSPQLRLYDHTVFVTYSLSFMILLLVVTTLIGEVSTAAASFAWLVPPVHMYRQLRGTYGLTRIHAGWRAAALTIFACIAIMLFALAIVGLGMFD